MTTCVVHLDNFCGQYYPGNTITGKVICSFSKPINIRGVKVSLQGKEYTEWKGKVTAVSHGKDSNPPNYTMVHYTGNNIVLDIVNTLTGEGTYDAGRHEYQFSFNLPKNLPGTYQGLKGWIKYKVKGTTIIPFGIDYQDVKEIKIVSPVDLNNIPGVQLEPVTLTAEKTVRWLFKSCGLITMKMYLNKNAFALGERTNVRLDLTNMSTENVTKVEAKMMLITESNVTNPTKESKCDEEILAIASDTGVGAHGERTYQFDMVVPESVVLTNFGICRLFKQSAKIEVIAHLSGFYSNLELKAPIYLGSMPQRRDVLRGFTDFYENSHAQPVSEPYGYSSGIGQPPSAPREHPPPYSQFPQHAQPSHIYPVVQPTAPPHVVAQVQSKETLKPSEKFDDDFLLI